MWTARTNDGFRMSMWELAADGEGGLTASKARVFAGHTGDINSIAFTRTHAPGDKIHVLTASSDGTARIWKIDPAAPMPSGGGGSVGDTVVTTVAESIALQGHTDCVNAAKFCKIGHIVTCSADKSAIVWGPDHTIMHRFDGHTGSVYDADLSQCGAVLFTGGADSKLRVWDLQAGVEMQCIPSPSCIKFVSWCEFTADLVIGCSTTATRCACKNFVLRIPNGSTLLETLTPGALLLAEMVDIRNSNPQDHYGAVSRLIASSRPLPFSSWDSSIAYFCELARTGSVAGLKRTIFEQNVPASFFSYARLLTAAVEGQQVQTVDLVLSEFVKSVENHNEVASSLAIKRLMITGVQTDVTCSMRNAVIAALRVYPEVVQEFLLKLPLLTAHKVVAEGFSNMASIEADGMIIAPSRYSQPRGFWAEHEAVTEGLGTTEGRLACLGNAEGSIVVETLLVPFLGLAAADSEFLDVLMDQRSSRFFGSTIVAAVVRQP